jgi:CO/xanthine dehydrogenase FAD-binding subunit
MPLVNRGDIQPKTLIDINRLPGLAGITRDGAVIEIGALARLETVRVNPLVTENLPLLAAALAWVANPAIRQRGTLVGNVVHQGPGAEAVAAAWLIGATLICATQSGVVERALSATVAGDLVLALRLPCAPVGARAGFYEVQRRLHHVGLVGAGVMWTPDKGVSIVLSGMTDLPLITPAIADAINRGCCDDRALQESLEQDLGDRSVRSDLHATARYRRDVAPVVVRRAVKLAGIDGRMR